MNQPEQFPDSASQHPASPAPPPLQPPRMAVHDPRVKSPAVACCLSLMPGLGQVYVGYYQRGFFNALVVAGLISFLASMADQEVGPLIPLAALFMAFFWLYNMIDAARRATLYNQALAGGVEVGLPEDFPTPGLRGSIAGGATFVGVGLILLLHTRFDMSLAWLEDWWPAGLILFGGYLVFKAIQDRAADDGGS